EKEMRLNWNHGRLRTLRRCPLPPQPDNVTRRANMPITGGAACNERHADHGSRSDDSGNGRVFRSQWTIPATGRSDPPPKSHNAPATADSRVVKRDEASVIDAAI